MAFYSPPQGCRVPSSISLASLSLDSSWDLEAIIQHEMEAKRNGSNRRSGGSRKLLRGKSEERTLWEEDSEELMEHGEVVILPAVRRCFSVEPQARRLPF